MPTIEAVEQARENLIAAINSSDGQNVIFDTGVIAGSIVTELRNNSEIIKILVAQNEVPYDKVPYVLHRIQYFYGLLTKYFVLVAAKHLLLLESIEEFVALPENQRNFSLESRKNLVRLRLMRKHWKEYERIDLQVCNASATFFSDAQTTAANVIISKNRSDAASASRYCLMFAAKIQMFLDSNEGIITSLNDALKEQRTIDIPRLAQMSQSLIEKRQLIFTE